MKKEWTDILKEKLSQSEATPPDSLWQEISSSLDKSAVKPVATRRLLLLKYVAAAASVLLLMGVAIYLFVGHKDVESKTAIASSNNHSPAAPSQDNHGSVAVGNADNPASSTLHHAEKITTESVTDEAFQPQAETLGEASDGIVEAASDGKTTSTKTVEQPNSDSEKIPLVIERKKHDPWAVSLYACNTNFPESQSDMASCNPGPDIVDGNESEDNSAGEDSATRAYEGDKVTDAKHKQPVRLGVSVRFPLSQSLSVSGGVTYSMLSSTLSWTTPSNRWYETDQTLHYIGIPVSVDYNLPSFKFMSFYLTAGGMVEKCVYGVSKRGKAPTSERVMDKPLQWSVFAGAGIQFNFSRHVAIYAEPLASYYFNNGSEIVNIYKDRPLNFDLRIGLRYTLRPHPQKNTRPLH